MAIFDPRIRTTTPPARLTPTAFGVLALGWVFVQAPFASLALAQARRQHPQRRT